MTGVENRPEMEEVRRRGDACVHERGGRRWRRRCGCAGVVVGDRERLCDCVKIVTERQRESERLRTKMRGAE
ncbi:hypothetical protein LguiA_030300 [Lonicera macranthoides]